MSAAPVHAVTLRPSGWRFACAADDSVLGAAARAAIRLPSSCRNGTCRACMCRLQAGEVTHAVAWPGLSPEEKAEGWILPCVARPCSDLVIDSPHAAPLAPRAAAPLPLTGAKRR